MRSTKKIISIPNAGKGKKELDHFRGNVNWYNHSGKQFDSLLKN